jgi:hypothetical protein
VDLGDIGLAGSTCKNGNVYTVTGSGTGIGGLSDQFQFAYTNNDNADYDVTGRLTQQDQSNPLNKTGIMVRDSLTNTSRFAYLYSMNNGYNIIFEYRNQPAGPTSIVTLPNHYTLPVWMKISKSGTKYSAFISSDNISWTQVGNQTDLNFGNDPANIPNYGMSVTSANNLSLSASRFDNFSLDVSNPLPIRLLNFSAKSVNHDHVLISWATSMEHLVDHFEIQKSIDKTGFETIATLKATGESETPRYYSVNDNNPATGNNYYRLKEMDRDNNVFYSPVVSAKFEELQGFDIYPNPAENYTTIKSARSPILTVDLYDAAGKRIQSIQSDGSRHTLQLNTTELSNGVYIIRVKTALGVYRQKLFKH